MKLTTAVTFLALTFLAIGSFIGIIRCAAYRFVMTIFAKGGSETALCHS